ncbi:helix-turn-helix transcriptional regulator [Streptomyces sp. NPDC055036]
MPADRQQRQRNPPTSKNADAHPVSSRQHRQRPHTPLLTRLTSADARHHPETPGQRVPLTLLTPPATPNEQNGYAPRGPVTMRRESHRQSSDELIPLTDVLDELGITRATWYRWRNRGYGPEVRRLPNGRLRVRRSALNAFLNELEVA